MLRVDTNVLVDVLQNDPQWADWSIAQLRAQSQLHKLVINPVVYAELSLSFSTLPISICSPYRTASGRGGQPGT